MKKISLFLVLTLLFYGQIFAQNTEKYKTYHNQRFGFCLQYPESFEAGIAPSNGDGLGFYSEKYDSKITVYGALQMPEETLKSFFEAENKDINITYSVLKEDKNYFVISGFIPEKAGIFYRKTVLKDEVFLTLIYEYPLEYADYFKNTIEEITPNFPNCGHKVPTFTLDLKAFPEVQKLLESGKEEIIISIDLYGEPKKQLDPKAKKYLDDYEADLYIGNFRFQLDKSGKFVFENQTVPEIAFENLKDPNYWVSINVFSSRKSSENNLFEASYIGKKIMDMQDKTHTITIKMLK